MNRRTLVLLLMSPGLVVSGAAAGAGAAANEALDQLMQLPRIGFAAIDPVWDGAILADGDIDGVIAQLRALGADPGETPHRRANALLASSHMNWRRGRLREAMRDIDSALEIRRDVDLTWHKARLLDAAGDAAQASRWYEQALAMAGDSKDAEAIRLRMTFVQVAERNVAALAELARQREGDFRNRAAVALAILGYYPEAVDLYEVSGTDSELFRQHLRVAQWALRSADAPLAQEHAWQAVRAATLARDRLYGLAILVESHALDGSYDRLLARFELQGDLSEEEQRVRIDVLGRSGRYDLAIDLFRREQALTVAAQRQLLRMHRAAGQDAAMVAEYRRLMATDPTEVEWPTGLSQYYMEEGEPEMARDLWSEFLGRDWTASAEALLMAAETMARFGFDDLALEATETCVRLGQSVAAALLFQFELHVDRGRIADAEEVLRRVDGALAPDAAERISLADAYERIERPRSALRVWEAFGSAKDGLSVDERMRMAWLYDTVGDQERALSIWQALWEETTLASRRRLVEDRLMLLAAESGRLGDIAVELEERLANGTADENDSGLLVRIYTKVGDTASAVEVIQEYFSRQDNGDGSAVIASLQEEAKVHQYLDDFDAYERTLRRLLEIDPDNDVEYLQGLMLNALERNAAGAGSGDSVQLHELLEAMRRVDSASTTGEFEAGVLVLAGQNLEAIDAYRRSLAETPERIDNYLLMADLLNQTGRGDEAVATLQYLAERAEEDDLFLVAIDGIINTNRTSVDALRWAQRITLERLTGNDDRIYLYELLGDLAEELEDTEMYLSALENSLAHANSRRSAVLRELVALTAERVGFGVSPLEVQRPDPVRNAIYGRRLIALDEELPPEVYVTLGRAFLKLDDPDSAQKAFDMAVDITGRTSVVEQAGDLFDRAGYARQAAQQYEQALIRDTGNVDAMLKLGHVRARVGLTDNAIKLYERGLDEVLQRQPAAIERGLEDRPPPEPTTATFEYRRYYGRLLKGLLSTLPPGGGEPTTADRASVVAAYLDRLVRAHEAELARVVSGAGERPEPLVYYPRLNFLAKLARRAAIDTGHVDLADRLDEQLLGRFAADPVLRRELVAERLVWGLPASAQRLLVAGSPGAQFADLGEAIAASTSADTAAIASVDSLRRRALQDRSFEVAVNAATVQGDQAAALSIYREWVRDPSAAAEAVYHAQRVLDGRHYESLCRFVAGMVGGTTGYGEELLNSAPGPQMLLYHSQKTGRFKVLRHIEETLGAPLFDERRILALVNQSSDWGQLDLVYVMQKVSPQQQVDILGRYAKSLSKDIIFSWVRAINALEVVLSTPLEPALATTLARELQIALSDLQSYSATTLSYGRFEHVHPANLSVLEDLDSFLAARYPTWFAAGYFTSQFLRHQGDDARALAAFVATALRMQRQARLASVDLISGYESQALYSRYVETFADFIYPRRWEQLSRLLDEREAGAGSSDEDVLGLRIELLLNRPGAGVHDYVTLLEAQEARFPGSEPVLARLYAAYERAGRTNEALQALQALVEMTPGTPDYRLQLAALWAREGNPVAAVQAAPGDPVPDFVGPELPGERRFVYPSVLERYPVLRKYLDQVRAIESGGDVRQAQLGFHALLQVLPLPGMTAYEFSQETDDAPFLSHLEFFTLLWHEGMAAAPAGAPAWPQDALAAIEADTPDDGPAAGSVRFIDRVIDYPFAVVELEAHLRTLDAGDLDEKYLFYQALADAYRRHGLASARLQQLTAELRAGAIDRKGLTLWLLLAAEAPHSAAGESVILFESSRVDRDGLSQYQRVLVARLYARAGFGRQAVDLYRTVAAAVLVLRSLNDQNEALVSDRYGKTHGLTLFTARGLFEDAAKHLEADDLNAFADVLLELTAPAPDADLTDIYSRFVMWLLRHRLEAGVGVGRFQSALDGALSMLGTSREDAFEAAYVLARAGDVSGGLEMLRAAMARGAGLRTSIYTQLLSIEYERVLGTRVLQPFAMPTYELPSPATFRHVIPAHSDAWLGAADWALAVAAAVPQWIATAEIDVDVALQVQSLATLRLQQLGKPEAAADAGRHLIAALGAADRPSVHASTLALAAADAVGGEVAPETLRALARQGRIGVTAVAAVVRGVAARQGAGEALRVGEAAAEFTLDDSLLTELVGNARNLADVPTLQRWESVQREAEDARVALARARSESRAGVAGRR